MLLHFSILLEYILFDAQTLFLRNFSISTEMEWSVLSLPFWLIGLIIINSILAHVLGEKLFLSTGSLKKCVFVHSTATHPSPTIILLQNVFKVLIVMRVYSHYSS